MVKQPQNILEELRNSIREFVQEREWDKFHTPKNLAVSLSVEAAELLEHFQWLRTGDKAELGVAKVDHIKAEMADVLIYLIRLADKLDVDLAGAVHSKLEVNRMKYPAEKVRGSAKKYDEY
jgi:NTP pyrophosphatase (non-canonical NTP hydrolase)